MNKVITAIIERRSIRKYTEKQVPKDVLEQILYSATFSPNAGNRQTTQIVICQDAKLNEKLGHINQLAFHGRISTQEKYISKDQPSIADDSSIASGFYGAPTVITLFGPRSFLYTEADCWIMANNIALAAYSLNIGSCILGRAADTFASDLGQQLTTEWNIPEEYEAKVHITLGYPAGGFSERKPREYPPPIIVR